MAHAVPPERAARHLLRLRWLAVVLAGYVAAAFVVPILTPAAVNDDLLYTRSAQLLSAGHFTILPITETTVIFPVAFGALFGVVFHPSIGVLRVSTFVLSLAGGVALYGLCRELGVSRPRSALGVAVYLFEPLAFVLAFTFMSDASLAALVVVATYFYVRGLRTGAVDARFVVLGSVFASFAFLSRQPGALVPVAVLVYLFVTRRIDEEHGGVRLMLEVALVPAVALVGYYVWSTYFRTAPPGVAIGNPYAKSVGSESVGGWFRFAGRITFVQLAYLGLFLLPIVVGVLHAGGRLVRGASRAVWWFVGAWAAVLLAGVAFYGHGRARMPYAAQFLGVQGVGPGDVRGARTSLVGHQMLTVLQDVLTVACVLASLFVALLIARRVFARGARTNAAPALVGAVLLSQVAGVVIVSIGTRDGAAPTFDRYLLPLLPLTVALVLWASRDVRLAKWPTAVVAGALAVFSVMATHDFLVYQGTAWRLAAYAHDHGVPMQAIDGGASWDGYRLYEYSLTHPVRHTALPVGLGKLPSSITTSPWWISFYAPVDRGDYVVSTVRLELFHVVRRVRYSSWLHGRPETMYLLRRPTPDELRLAATRAARAPASAARLR